MNGLESNNLCMVVNCPFMNVITCSNIYICTKPYCKNRVKVNSSSIITTRTDTDYYPKANLVIKENNS